MIALVLFAFAAGTLRAAVSDDHPAIKIIALLEKLQQQVKEEGAASEAGRAQFVNLGSYCCPEL
jgi:hypothetical protein